MVLRFQDLASPGVDDLLTYEPGRPLEEVARELGIQDLWGIDKLASNENALGPSPLAIEAVRREADRMHLYPDGSAYHLLRDLAEVLDLTPQHLVLTNGSNEAIELIAHVFLHPGTSVVASEYAFVVYRLIAALAGAQFIEAPSRNYGHDPVEMKNAVRKDTRIVFIANPNNPTGTMWDGCRLEAFVEGLPDYVLPVIDEAYIDLIPPEERPPTLDWVREGRPVILLRTFSKAFGLAGLRIGYGVARPDAIQLLQKVRQPFNVNAIAQVAARSALRDDAFLQRSRDLVVAERSFLEVGLMALKCETVPSHANFLLVKTGKGRQVFDALQSEGIIVRPMDGYGLPEFIRVTVGTRRQNERFLDALVKILSGGDL